jgi:dipeptidyl aminopeptidase/acylaminoacyl peptidase
VVIYNRGSYVAGDLAPALAPLLRRFARAGFYVLAPQYRGSDGGEGRDELGGADVADVLNLLPLAARLDHADTSRLFMYGESRGGMMTYQAIRRRMPLKAAATVGGFTDVEAVMAADERSRKAAATIWPDFEARREEIVRTRSARLGADELDVPLLLLHGRQDKQVSASQSLDLALRLHALGRPYELHVFADESHTLGERSETRDSLVIAWFQAHLGP